MNRLSKLVMLATAGLLSLPMGLAAPPAFAQSQPMNEYAAKVVCGVPQHSMVAAQGNYFTAVNVHNSSGLTAVRWKVALAGNNVGGPISGFEAPVLTTDQALDIDCRAMRNRLAASNIPVPAFFTGFVVIQCPRPLDVVAVYTAAPTTGQVSTMHTERVPGRRIE